MSESKKLPNITTKRGDGGYTNLWDGKLIHKGSRVIELQSYLDLFDSSLGLLHENTDLSIDKLEILDSIKKIQSRLIYLKGEICTSKENWDKFYKTKPMISDVDVDYLEKCSSAIKTVLEEKLYDITGWVLYGEEGGLTAQIDYAGRLCRLCEAKMYQVQMEDVLYRKELYVFMNRLSDYLYWAARYFSNK